MKALILSGGTGTRLRPITHTSAKQLVPVANKPILFYGIEAMGAAGITDIGIIVGETGREVRAAVGDGSRFGASVTFIPQEAPLGLAHAVMIARRLSRRRRVRDVPGRQPDQGRHHASSSTSSAGRAGRRRSCSRRSRSPSSFGVAELDGRAGGAAGGEAAEPASDLALVGVYLFDARVFEAIERIKPSRARRARDH